MLKFSQNTEMHSQKKEEPSLPSNVNPMLKLDLDEPEIKLPAHLKVKQEKTEAVQKEDKKVHDAIDDETESIRREVYLPYKHREWVENCKAHPGNIVEPASLAVVQTEVQLDDYDLHKSLPPEPIKEGKLSSLQIESIIKAANRHRIILPNGERAGFFIGDAAGVGKGRQIAGIVMDNFSRGRTRHIWFSVSTDLIIDAKRDLSDIGCFIHVIDGCTAIDQATKLFGLGDSVKTGVVFCTYSTLVSSTLSGALGQVRKTRLQQLIDWCGGSQFDGCLVFDECHKAKSFVPGEENTGSKVALAVCAIQRALPRARVLYCSATGVTDIKNMAFMERLGLWGVSSPFKNYEGFVDTIQKKGLGIAEMLAMDMKREGMYVSRMLGFNDAIFENDEHCLTDQQRLMYNMSAHIWNEVRKALALAIGRCCCNNPAISRMFWSQHQKFFQQLCISMKVDKVVAEAKKALEDGKCVVIGLQNTGEAHLENKRTRDGNTDGFISSCREILINFLNNHFPVEVQYIVTSADTTAVRRVDDWSLQARTMLLRYAEQLELSDNALDSLIDKLGGPMHVAEMTGRKGRIVRYNSESKPQYEQRQHSTCLSDQSLNVRERDEFMSGKKLIAIISDAASTGISLHADRKCENQRQRVHITLQLPWSADKAVQQLGRSHRSNQVSGPIYKLVTTELGGERRFAASVARRLQSLGALTKGDRRAASVADLSQFNYDTLYGRSALKLMYQQICAGTVPEMISLTDLTYGQITREQFIEYMKDCLVTMGMLTEWEMEHGSQVSDQNARDVNRFLNRILGLQVALQNLIFNYFVKCLDVIVSVAKREGKFNEGFVDLTGNSIEIEGEAKPVFTSLTTDSRLLTLLVDRGMPWPDALRRYEEHKDMDKLTGFYRTRNPMHNKHFYLLITPKENVKNCYKITRPNTGINYQEIYYEDVRLKYDKISVEKAEVEWIKMYEDSAIRCIHGNNCHFTPDCQVGMRKYKVTLICGSLLRILPVLEQTMFKHGMRTNLSKYESAMKVMRVCLDNGERLLGIQYPAILMNLAEKEALALAEEKKDAATADMKEIIEPVAAVVPKLYKIASQPPKTIKTYFTVIKSGKDERHHSALFDSVSPSLSISNGAKRKLHNEHDDDIICVFDSKTPTGPVDKPSPAPPSHSDGNSTKPAAKRKLSAKLAAESKVVDDDYRPVVVELSVEDSEFQITTRAAVKRAKLNHN